MSNRLLIPNTTQVPNVLLDRLMPALKNTSLRVALAIVRFTYGFQKQADKISLSQLQKITGLSRQGVVNGVAALGPLLKIKPGAKGRGANEYSLNLDISTGQLVNHSDQSTNLTSQNHGSQVVNDFDSPKPIRSKPNKTGTDALESFPHRKKKTVAPDPAALEAFDRFYQAYPRHVARQAALSAWVQLNPSPELQTSIMATLVRQAAENEGADMKFIPYPARWLNARRWEDEPLNGNGHAKPAQVKDLGEGFVEVDGRRMDRQTYERRFNATAR